MSHIVRRSRGGRGSRRLRDRLGGAAAEQRLGLGGVVSHILLGELGSLRGMLASDLLELVGLRLDNAGNLLQVLVDHLLVGLVDKRGYKGKGSGHQSKTPVWNNLDQPVGDQGSNTGLIVKLLSAQDACTTEIIGVC